MQKRVKMPLGIKITIGFHLLNIFLRNVKIYLIGGMFYAI